MTSPRDIARRLAAAEAQLASKAAPPTEDELTERDWLEHFEGCDFADEPEFAAALDSYRRALEEAEQRKDWQPPPDFRPDCNDRPKLRAQFWRDPWRFTQLHEALSRLWSLWLLHQRGIAPYIDHEFAELYDWYESRSERIHDLSRPTGLIDLGEGRMLNPTNVRYGLRQGPCDHSAAETIVAARLLRAVVEAKGEMSQCVT